MEAITTLLYQLQQDVALSTEPILWGYPQLLLEAPYTIASFDFEDDLLRILCHRCGVRGR